MSGNQEILLVSAEASSNTYALRLVQFFAGRNNIKFFGIGDQKMKASGFDCIGQAEKMAVVGVAEVIEHFSEIKAIFHQLLEAAKTRKPKLAILMDYPEFNLRLGKELKKIGVPVVYYISPQIWAWRRGRVRTMKAICDRVLLLFPFEEKFYLEHQVRCEFVGHPLLDEFARYQLKEDEIKTSRGRFGWNESHFVLGLMPGSRKGELDRHLAIQIETVRGLYLRNKNLRVAFLLAPSFTREQFIERLTKNGDLGFPFVILQDEPFGMIQILDAALVASGTATLQVGLCEKPMVIMYRMKWFSWLLAKIFVRGVKFFGIVNLILGHEAVPERFQFGASKKELGRLLQLLISDRKEYDRQKNELATIREKLGSGGVTSRVAKVLEAYL